MESLGIVLGLAILFLAMMIGLSAWAARQLPSGPVPVHFDTKGKADAFGSRWITLGILPASYIVVLALTLAISHGSGPVSPLELIVSQLVLGVSLLAAHGFVVFLLLRWARSS